MRFTSLIVELVRAKPRWILWSAVLALALLWLLVPAALYLSPPGDAPTVLAFGREYQVGTALGPPLSFWLADIAFRAVGGYAFGVYLLAQICFAVMMGAVFMLARALVGAQQGVLAALLTLAIAAFSFPGLEFGPDVLARPLWALTLLHAWRVIGERQRGAWFALSIEIGLLFLTTAMAPVLLALLAIFALATSRGRAALRSIDPLYGALVIAVIALPYMIWLARNGAALPRPALLSLEAYAWQSGGLFGALMLSALGVVALVAANARIFDRKSEDAPAIFRPPVDPLARLFVVFFGALPPLLFTLASPVFGFDHVAGGEGVALMLIGLLAVILGGDLIYLRRQQVLRTIWLLALAAPVIVVLTTVFVQPWTDATEAQTSLPARAMGKFFADNYRLRTNRPLPAVAGDPQIASLIGLGAPTRPQVLFSNLGKTPWVDAATINTGGGLVVWRAHDTVGAPPEAIAKMFPGLAAEVPRTFDRLIEGRLEPLRIGWGVVRPVAPK
ncbi:glycosyltransferase family 39 protein [[Pseudomonas] carboxydohydrogena]|uniref:Glycosyltransferase family 39 protein n=1 Tax=Afipia carboxydohydrogena TaxID=290 RepID=A0ABY8BPG4_AFICR|nr:glycosyltransferase family 39 protein [[Pseudomonas] carboxydohydrogena]WEF50819.1 glycosyltransferase family 39 protein [[Pseudomonas] carboxydohydrogena]